MIEPAVVKELHRLVKPDNVSLTNPTDVGECLMTNSNPRIIGTVTVSAPITDEMVDIVLVTAFDGNYGSCHYWADLNRIERYSNGVEWWKQVTFTDALERDEGNGDTKTYTVNAEQIVTAMQKFLDANSHMANDTITGYIRRAVMENDPGMIDGDAADCIIQVAAFGEVVYG